MNREYYYLVSTLPMLSLGAKPLCDSDAFLEQCADQLTPELQAQLAAVELVPNGQPCCELDRRRQAWETYVRNRLVRLRAAKRQQPVDRWLKSDSDAFPTDGRTVDELVNNRDPLSRERGLDELRWQRLDDFSVGHDFDFDALVAYRLRLLLAEKWIAGTAETGRQNLDNLVQQRFGEAETARVAVEPNS